MKIYIGNKKKPIILVKSTVVPGTMKKSILPILEKKSNKKAGKDFGLISNPEFSTRKYCNKRHKISSCSSSRWL